MRLNEHENIARDYSRARELRNNASSFEKKLWVALREQAALRKLKFRRQHAVHPYIADFACMKARLLIELDGYSHDTRLGYDGAREEKLKQMGFSVMRFRNEDLAESLEGVVNTILDRAELLIQNGTDISRDVSPLPNPPREGEGTLP